MKYKLQSHVTNLKNTNISNDINCFHLLNLKAFFEQLAKNLALRGFLVGHIHWI
nr:MAG TPA: hypothetical protein [Caudoviricetes sp.]